MYYLEAGFDSYQRINLMIKANEKQLYQRRSVCVCTRSKVEPEPATKTCYPHKLVTGPIF